ncbi:MAG: phosphotransferase [Candidatus Electrothrix sp. GW3-4]|uniref:aminoglycoside phosphotransferase family protein n=1 Tax=Candidatus Electrothrix sp. GW3-4 TaxID=3126740 RepID=UPI0030CFF67E
MNKDFIQQACQLLSTAGDAWPADRIHLSPLTPDGSLRRFCRIQHEDGRTRVAIAPPPDDAVGLQEAIAGWQIGRHLFAAGAPVPELYAFAEETGLLVCEDLGEQRLHDLVQEKGVDSEQVIQFYQQTVTELARMQVRGCQGFNSAWCWDTPRYDRVLMLERESGYFLQALCRDLLQLDMDEENIAQDFQTLADRASQADASFFLHRDFQSRNIMVQQGRVRFIDYQAGRLGPLAYDLASLLIDPYAGLPAPLQEELLEQYLATLTALLPYDRSQFRQEYLLLALQRNLQILGAFAFLSQQRGRPFFRQYLSPALHNLQALLAKTATSEYLCLKAVSRQCLERLEIARPDRT